MPTELLTGVGRLLQGDCFTGQTADKNGVPYTIKTGANKGQPTTKFYQTVAFDKNDPTFVEKIYPVLINEARVGYPQWFNAQGQCTNPKMALKYMDGDGVDTNGVPHNTKEGFAGHWVVRFGSMYPPRCFATGRYDPSMQLSAGAIKRGDYVRVSALVKPNTGAEIPGVYISASMVELVGVGAAITSGPDAGTVFGAAPVGQLPPGVSMTPQAPPGAMPGAMPGQPGMQPQYQQPPAGPQGPQGPQGMQPQYQQPAQPQAQYVPPQGPQGMAQPGLQPSAPPGMQPQHVQPNPGFVAGAVAGAPAGPQGGFPGAAPQAVQQRVMTAKANGWPYEEFIKQGYDDNRLLADGFMVWQ